MIVREVEDGQMKFAKDNDSCAGASHPITRFNVRCYECRPDRGSEKDSQWRVWQDVDCWALRTVSFPHYELMIAVLRHQILHPGIHAEHVEIHRHWFAYQRRFITVPDSNAGQGLLWIALPSKKFLLHLEFVISNVLHRTARVLCTEGYKSAEEENHSCFPKILAFAFAWAFEKEKRNTYVRWCWI